MNKIRSDDRRTHWASRRMSMNSPKVPVCQAPKEKIKWSVGIGLSWVQLERVNPTPFPHIQLERVNGLKRRLFLIAANWCSRETNLIRVTHLSTLAHNPITSQEPVSLLVYSCYLLQL
ncbi:hypothetical protein H5410_062393 [Solanum commersonii]|uniref:Uncharacterized protein n=1 Tax=Solanum commersonii TaxID=4109 RepID=A0A9J5WA92_SOLCO|nr:hypothetical protein H5410_062393 [Solanum commersonii]